MNKLFVLILTFGLLSINLVGQIVIKGKIVYNNEPVANASIFINNTTIGTTSDKNGAFNLSVPDGFHELIVSHIGFRAMRYPLITATFNKPLRFILSERVYVLNEVELGGTKDNKVVGTRHKEVAETRYNADWRYNLSVFKREFLGSSDFSKHCKILNPQALYFDLNAQNNMLTAYAQEPLHIRNTALGYDIYFNLEEFIKDNNSTTYLGYSQFVNLKGTKSQQKKWNKNRTIAYNGSTMHFYKSVLENRTREEGFIINQFLRKKNEKRPSQQEILKAENFLASSKVKIPYLKPTDNPKNVLDSALMVIGKVYLPVYIDYLHKSDIPASDIITIKNDITYLEFNDNLNIVYANKKEEKGFGKKKHEIPQTSSIIPMTTSSIINPKGILENPLDVVYEGYWSYEKFAHFLPLDYESLEEK